MLDEQVMRALLDSGPVGLVLIVAAWAISRILAVLKTEMNTRFDRIEGSVLEISKDVRDVDRRLARLEGQSLVLGPTIPPEVEE